LNKQAIVSFVSIYSLFPGNERKCEKVGIENFV